jgi:NAD(P)-dependent dehydrogenase (short-subunit alcohol dehydrogenase family)
MGWLDGYVACVTGGAASIGRGVVEEYLAEGAQVAVLDRDADALDALEREHPSVLAVHGDVRYLEDNERLVRETVDAFGKLDVFVGNVGVGANNLSLVDIPKDKLEAACDEMFGINIKGYLLGARASLPELLRTGGSMIFTCSYCSFRPAEDGALYVATKHAGAGIVRQLAFEFAPKVRVNGVAAGVAESQMTGLDSLGQGRIDAVLPGAEEIIPLGFIPEPRDHASAYVLLASRERARIITGSFLWTDSGFAVRGVGSSVGGAALDADALA